MILEIGCELADGRPRRLRLGARTIEVVEILDQWPGADHHYVKLRGGDRAVYIIRHDSAAERWELILYQTGDMPP